MLVYFGKARKGHIECVSRGQAELTVRLAELGISGKVRLPAALAPCLRLLDRLNRRIERARAKIRAVVRKSNG